MSEKKTDTDLNITFQEFQELCTEAGISTDNMEVLEQDFRAGTALADTTDALITDYEEHTSSYTENEAVNAMDTYMTLLAEAGDKEGARRAALKVAVQAIRFIAECCHDEGKN